MDTYHIIDEVVAVDSSTGIIKMASRKYVGKHISTIPEAIPFNLPLFQRVLDKIAVFQEQQ